MRLSGSPCPAKFGCAVEDFGECVREHGGPFFGRIAAGWFASFRVGGSQGTLALPSLTSCVAARHGSRRSGEVGADGLIGAADIRDALGGCPVQPYLLGVRQ